MEALTDVLMEAWSDFINQDDKATQFSIALSVFALLVAPFIGWFWTFLRARSKLRRLHRLEEEITYLSSERDAALKDLDLHRQLLNRWQPRNWIDQAVHTKETDGEEAAQSQLDLLIQNSSEDLSAAFLMLAKLTFDTNPSSEEVVRCGTLAVLLKPDDSDLAEQLDFFRSFQTSDNLSEQSKPLGRLVNAQPSSESWRTIDTILHQGRRLSAARKNIEARPLFRRALIIAETSGLLLEPIGFMARYNFARIEIILGNTSHGMSVAEEMASDAEKLGAAGLRHYAAAKLLIVEALNRNSNWNEADRTLSEVLPTVEAGLNENDVVRVDLKKAQMKTKKELGDNRKAIVIAKEVLPVERDLARASSERIYLIRFVETAIDFAELLKTAQQYEEALNYLSVNSNEIREALDSDLKLQFTHGALKSELLTHLKRYEEALHLLRPALKAGRSLYETSESILLSSLHHEVQLLILLDRTDEAIEKLSPIMEASEETWGKDNSMLRDARAFLAERLPEGSEKRV